MSVISQAIELSNLSDRHVFGHMQAARRDLLIRSQRCRWHTKVDQLHFLFWTGQKNVVQAFEERLQLTVFLSLPFLYLAHLDSRWTRDQPHLRASFERVRLIWRNLGSSSDTQIRLAKDNSGKAHSRLPSLRLSLQLIRIPAYLAPQSRHHLLDLLEGLPVSISQEMSTKRYQDRQWLSGLTLLKCMHLLPSVWSNRMLSGSLWRQWIRSSLESKHQRSTSPFLGSALWWECYLGWSRDKHWCQLHWPQGVTLASST